VIVAHHGGEPAMVAALAGSLGSASALLAIARYRIGQFFDRKRQRSWRNR
jgi:hypothetical protein